MELDIHRIGGGRLENLRLKRHELNLVPPGISVIRAATRQAAASELLAAYGQATNLHIAAQVVGSSNLERIRSAGFDAIATPSSRLPNHWRIVHPDGAIGFSDENLVRLAAAFENGEGIAP